AREDHLKLTIVPDSEKEGVMNEEEKEGDARSRSQLGAWRIDVVKSWCVQSGNWLTSASCGSCSKPGAGGAVAPYPKIFTYRDTGADLEFDLGGVESSSPF